MSTNSFMAKSVILVSALVGGVVGMFELSDRFMVSTEEDGKITTQSITGGLDNGQTGTTGGESGGGQSAAVETPDAPTRSVLERELATRIEEQLQKHDCAGVRVEQVTATARVVPDEETTHGFEGHTLEAAVVLAGSDGPERMRLVGSGKGPTGAIGATDMALRGFGEQVTQTEIFKANCKGK
ncbi:hypothetical protein FIU86_16960 [Roseovarius sp. THAF9]|uniref:hypothetical protein n=1 Tax=Roseovarius sp. THAF9 TaxID=2587847 RepID=UPI001268BC76|nr:hypothetical protein [Roseovarius sp. THAF9]QFT94544.1 hypothetical protein FIU86_16960 [Roseovarius sp. THAF9]